ncbi:nucleotidyl cyclase domain-containing protein [Anabaena azotica]|uniref:Uncharacterized protein n=1 Tax=Anabaena azotica FACHB-119 TaxID=947527 RepID=A0ABR8CWG1_9NOST|nr:hypothetical protein [Anabaena azotica]MBD2499285.1 hypothetical protein [Anabaena azotica FACHB-119]
MLAESMRSLVASLAIPHTQSKVSNYVSLKALYTAKNQGRNQAVSY